MEVVEYYEDTIKTNNPLVFRRYHIIDDNIEGEFTQYYRSGNIEFKYEYLKGFHHGKYKEYYDYPDGIKEKGHYINGLTQGIVKQYDTNGNITLIRNYKDNQMSGISVTFKSIDQKMTPWCIINYNPNKEPIWCDKLNHNLRGNLLYLSN